MKIQTTILNSASLSNLFNGSTITLVPSSSINTNISSIVWKTRYSSSAYNASADSYFDFLSLSFGVSSSIFPLTGLYINKSSNYITYFPGNIELPASCSLILKYSGSVPTTGDSTLQIDIYSDTQNVTDTAPIFNFESPVALSGSLLVSGSINTTNGSLIYSDKNVVDWNNQILRDTSNIVSIDWKNRELRDQSNNLALSYTNTGSSNGVRLYGTASNALTSSAVNPLNQNLIITGSLITTNSFGSINTSNGFVIRDQFNIKSLDATFKELYDDAGIISLDWQDRELRDANNNIVLSYTDSSSAQFYGTSSTANAAGSQDEIQFNNNGILGADPTFKWDGSAIRIDTGDGGYIGNGGIVDTNDIGFFTAGGDAPIAVYDPAGVFHYSNSAYKYNNNTSNHIFTGSLDISSSLKVTGSIALAGNQQITGSILFASSSTDHYISGVDYILFDTADHTPTITGQLGWDTGNGTLDLGLSGSAGAIPTFNIGQQQLARVYNAQGSPITKGQVVYVSGSQGNRIAVKLAAATGDDLSAGTLGFVYDTIPTGGEGYIITQGPLYKINTSAYTTGASIYLSSSAGQYTQTRPVAPIHEVRLGYIERVDNSVGSIYVKVDNGYEIDELHDVYVVSPTSGDLLVRSASLWINSKQLTGSYNLTGSLTATSFTGSLFGTSSWAHSSSQALTASYTPNALITASVSSSTLTFTKGNGSTFNLTVDTGSGGGGTPGGNDTYIQFNSGSSFAGYANFIYDYSNNRVNYNNNIDPYSTPLTNTNANTIELFNVNSNIQIDSTNYQFNTSQFPYCKYITANTLDKIISFDTNAGTSLGPGLKMHAFKCEYTLLTLSSVDVMVDTSRVGTLYCTWDEDKATYNPVITDTFTTSPGGVVNKLDDAVFTVDWNGANIELSVDLGVLPSVNVVFNGLFTIFSMR